MAKDSRHKKTLIIKSDNNIVNMTICGHAPDGPGSIDFHADNTRLILGARGEVIETKKLK